MLAGAFNFRDLGGLPVRGGRVTRTGRLFRSDTLQALTAPDVALLRSRLGLRAVVDLRLREEVEHEGRGLLGEAPEVRYFHAPLGMAAVEPGTPPEAVLPRLYASCLASPSLPAAINAVAAVVDAPVLFHCAAGKDRTGILAALVLALVGVEETEIEADYLRSAAAMAPIVERFRGWPRYAAHMAAVPPEVYRVEVAPIRAVLRAVLDAPGGAAGWALQRGVSAGAIHALRQHLCAAVP